MRKFNYKYSKIWPTQDQGQDPATKKKFNRKKENNDIFQNSVDDIILQDNMKLSVEEEEHENIDSEVDKNNIYEIDNMSIYENI